METDTILLMTILVIVSSLFTYFIIRNKPQLTKNKPIKTAKDELESLVKEQVRVIQDNYLEQIQMLKKDKSNLQNKVNRIEGLYNKLKSEVNQYEDEDSAEDEESIIALQQQYEIDPQKAIEYATKLKLNPAGLNNPALTPLIWEKIKEHQDIALMLGIIRPRNGIKTIETIGTGQAGGQSDIYAELQKNGQYA